MEFNQGPVWQEGEYALYRSLTVGQVQHIGKKLQHCTRTADHAERYLNFSLMFGFARNTTFLTALSVQQCGGQLWLCEYATVQNKEVKGREKFFEPLKHAVLQLDDIVGAPVLKPPPFIDGPGNPEEYDFEHVRLLNFLRERGESFEVIYKRFCEGKAAHLMREVYRRELYPSLDDTDRLELLVMLATRVAPPLNQKIPPAILTGQPTLPLGR